MTSITNAWIGHYSLRIGSGMLIIGGLCSFEMNSALVPDNCKQNLLQAYRKLTATEGAEGVFHLQFTSKSTYRTPDRQGTQQTTVKGELYSQGVRTFFQTGDMSVWQDGKYIATLIHTQRTVFINRIAPGQSTTNPARIFMVRDSLIQLGKLLQCNLVQVGKQTQQHTQLTYTGAVASRLQIKSLDFWVSPQQTLQTLAIEYMPGAAVQKVIFSFPVQERLAASSKITDDARAKVVDTQGRLLPAYHGYRLVDHTTQ